MSKIKICDVCNTSFEARNSIHKYCSSDCKMVISKARARELYQSSEKFRDEVRRRCSKPEAVARRRTYAASPEARERARVKDREYRSRPEIKAHLQERAREYRAKQEVREHLREQAREYRTRPDVKARRLQYVRDYNSRNREHIRERDRERNSIPENRIRLREQKRALATPEAREAKKRKDREMRAKMAAAYTALKELGIEI